VNTAHATRPIHAKHATRERDRALLYHYVAWEPWAILGGTLGVALGDIDRVGLAYGVWEGIAIPLDKKAFGFRGFGSDQEFYLALKIWKYNTLDFNN
jgi:hypothetical protein